VGQWSWSARLGRGTDDGVEVGPLVSRAGREKVAELVNDAVREGGTVASGGRIVDRPGWSECTEARDQFLSREH